MEKQTRGDQKVDSRRSIPYSGDPVYYAGLRRSSYGLHKRNTDDDWWAVRAGEYAADLSAALLDSGYVMPVIIQIVSGYSSDGGSVLEFDRPAAFKGRTPGMKFLNDRGIDHEKALATYDARSVKAIIQFEPGNTDVAANIELAHLKFGHHKCIIGYGIDTEWYRTSESADETGLPVTDEDAAQWMEKILALNPGYTLFLKHWDPAHIPPKYRHANLWFLSDSQIFPSLDSCMDDFSHWARSFPEHTVGYQFGYPRDEHWWTRMEKPSREIAQRIAADIPSVKYFFWVDFTADEVTF
jgi:hypothetical protein